MVTFAAVRLLASGDARLTFDSVSTLLLVAGFAVAYAAILAMPIRLWTAPRPATLVLAFVVSVAWPLSGYPVPAAIVATIAVGLSLGRDSRCPGGLRVSGGWPAGLLAAVAAVTVCAGLATAKTHPVPPPTAPAATAHPVPAPSLDLGAESEIDASPVHPDPTADAPEPTPSAAPEADTPEPAPSPAPEAPRRSPPRPRRPRAADRDARPNRRPVRGAQGRHARYTAHDGHARGRARHTAHSRRARTLPVRDARRAGGAETFVRDYYAALDAKRFDDAWASLSPSVQKAFGGLAHWRAGYAQTVSSTAAGPRGRDRGHDHDGPSRPHCPRPRLRSEQRFSVTWQLQREADESERDRTPRARARRQPCR